MNVAMELLPRVTVMAPLGDIDASSAPDFQEKVLAAVQTSAQLLLDLSGVPFVSSAGLRALLLVYRQANAKKATVVLCGLHEDVRRSMAATGFLHFFRDCGSREVALAAME